MNRRTTQILDELYPYTPEEMRCGMKKVRKARLRMSLIPEINRLIDEGKTNEEIIKSYDRSRATSNMG